MNQYETSKELNNIIQDSANKTRMNRPVLEELGESFSRNTDKFEEDEDAREFLRELGIIHGEDL